MLRRLVVAAAAVSCATPPPARPHSDRVALRIDAAEATAVLAVSASPTDDGWRRLFSSDGYRRLLVREQAMHRTLDESEMRAFVMSPDLAARRASLADAVAHWSTVDLDAIASRVFAYLPADAKLVATIYPVIKPKPNSFVNFDDHGAAIFVSVDPARSAEDFDNTIAHELHHIGFASIKDAPCSAAPAICEARKWSGAFGEGFAMLAAAGGSEIHPHRFSPPADRARWDHDVAAFDADLAKLQAFFTDVLSGKLDSAAAGEAAGELYGVQGPWYTVGWVMASSIERCFGRPRLIEAMHRSWTVLGLWNETRARCPTKTGTATAVWDPAVVRAIDG